MTERGTALQIIAMNNRHDHLLETEHWNQEMEMDDENSEVKSKNSSSNFVSHINANTLSL